MVNFSDLHPKEIELILSNSLMYLPRSDLKACRLASTQFNTATTPYYYSELLLVYPAKTSEFGDKTLFQRVTQSFSQLITQYKKYSSLVKYIELNIFCNKNLIQTILKEFPNLEGIRFTYCDFFEIDTNWIYREFWELDDMVLVGCSDMMEEGCFYDLDSLEFPMESRSSKVIESVEA
jgi:hypothetical protein